MLHGRLRVLYKPLPEGVVLHTLLYQPAFHLCPTRPFAHALPSPFVLDRPCVLRVVPDCGVRRSHYPIPPTAGQTEDRLAATFSELRTSEVRVIGGPRRYPQA